MIVIVARGEAIGPCREPSNHHTPKSHLRPSRLSEIFFSQAKTMDQYAVISPRPRFNANLGVHWQGAHGGLGCRRSWSGATGRSAILAFTQLFDVGSMQ